MDIQFIIVAVIVLLAAGLMFRAVWKRVRSFMPKSDCGTDCGCGTSDNKSTPKKA
jgi:FeoB-associated Cys-rich membrane protein